VILNYKNLSLNNPDYQKAIADENFSKENITLLRSSFYPSLNLSQTAGKSNRNNGAWSDTWSIGAELSFPLFSGGKDYFNLKSSHESFRSAVLLKKNILDTNFVKLKDTFTKYLEIVEKLEVDALFVEAGTSRARIAKEKYNNGLLTFDEWDIIENDLITRQKTLVQTERDRVIAEALWEQVQGRGVIK
jgi:outer membrane protein TolC